LQHPYATDFDPALEHSAFLHYTMTITNGADPEIRPLKVLIVGAGIGGLTAAIALRNQGHDIQIFEQSHLATETGAAIHLAPNANGLLRRLGIFAEEFGANPMERVSYFPMTRGRSTN
jgi:2-polyprenyl-6-methoxyphenol hydroxylase-like FAD-dependent oxidoreductase